MDTAIALLHSLGVYGYSHSIITFIGGLWIQPYHYCIHWGFMDTAISLLHSLGVYGYSHSIITFTRGSWIVDIDISVLLFSKILRVFYGPKEHLNLFMLYTHSHNIFIFSGDF